MSGAPAGRYLNSKVNLNNFMQKLTRVLNQLFSNNELPWLAEPEPEN